MRGISELKRGNAAILFCRLFFVVHDCFAFRIYVHCSSCFIYTFWFIGETTKKYAYLRLTWTDTSTQKRHRVLAISNDFFLLFHLVVIPSWTTYYIIHEKIPEKRISSREKCNHRVSVCLLYVAREGNLSIFSVYGCGVYIPRIVVHCHLILLNKNVLCQNLESQKSINTKHAHNS